MKTIYKYPLREKFHQDVPTTLRPLYVGLDPTGDPCLWVEVDIEVNPKGRLTTTIVGTGQPVDSTKTYAGTYLDGPFVWHVYYEHRP